MKQPNNALRILQTSYHQTALTTTELVNSGYICIWYSTDPSAITERIDDSELCCYQVVPAGETHDKYRPTYVLWRKWNANFKPCEQCGYPEGIERFEIQTAEECSAPPRQVSLGFCCTLCECDVCENAPWTTTVIIDAESTAKVCDGCKDYYN